MVTNRRKKVEVRADELVKPTPRRRVEKICMRMYVIFLNYIIM